MNFKKLLSITAVAFLGLAAAHAADTDKKDEKTTDTSHNPITGTDTTKTVETHVDDKGTHGGKTKHKKTTTKKTTDDGKVKVEENKETTSEAPKN